MVVSAEKRIKAYNIKKATMPEAYKNMIAEADVGVYNQLSEINARVNAILTAAGITGGRRVDYQRFAMKIYSAWKNNTLTPTKVSSLVAFYRDAYGCDPGILDAIVAELKAMGIGA